MSQLDAFGGGTHQRANSPGLVWRSCGVAQVESATALCRAGLPQRPSSRQQALPLVCRSSI